VRKCAASFAVAGALCMMLVLEFGSLPGKTQQRSGHVRSSVGAAQRYCPIYRNYLGFQYLAGFHKRD